MHNNHSLLHSAKLVCSQFSHFDEPQEIAFTEIYFCFVLSIWKVKAVENYFCEYFCTLFFSCLDLYVGFYFLLFHGCMQLPLNSSFSFPAVPFSVQEVIYFIFLYQEITTPHDIIRMVSKRRL
jgi:hypothetical protein